MVKKQPIDSQDAPQYTRWVAAGGALYTLGIFFFGWKRLPYHHAIWHLFVIAGSTCHYFAILFYLVPKP